MTRSGIASCWTAASTTWSTSTCPARNTRSTASPMPMAGCCTWHRGAGHGCRSSSLLRTASRCWSGACSRSSSTRPGRTTNCCWSTTPAPPRCATGCIRSPASLPGACGWSRRPARSPRPPPAISPPWTRAGRSACSSTRTRRRCSRSGCTPCSTTACARRWGSSAHAPWRPTAPSPMPACCPGCARAPAGCSSASRCRPAVTWTACGWPRTARRSPAAACWSGATCSTSSVDSTPPHSPTGARMSICACAPARSGGWWSARPRRCCCTGPNRRNRRQDWIDAIRMHLADLPASLAAGHALRAAVRRDWML